MNGTSEDKEDRMSRIAKAAYLMVKGSLAEDLENIEELTEALQFAGFNPTKRSLTRHWLETTNRLTYSQFCNITEIEPIPTEKSLLDMFEKLDEKNVGYLTHDEFLLNMTTRGEKIPLEVIENLIENENYNQDKKFFYRKFCHDIIETKDKLANIALEKLQKDEEEFMVNSKTYKVRRKTASPTKSSSSSPTKSFSHSPAKYQSLIPAPNKSLSESPTKSLSPSSDDVVTPSNWTCNLKSKGCFYFENDNIISHQFALIVKKKSKHKIFIQSLPQFRNSCHGIDVQLYVYDENKRYICRSDTMDQEGRWGWQGELAPGRYTLVPFTSGARFKRRCSTPAKDVPLVERYPKIKLTRDFQNVLTDIFSKADLDGNGTLSRTEFNLFNWRTSGEEVSDDEWGVVVENFPLKDGELTLDGFLTLHQMEAEDNNGDDAELRVTLQTMGYNSQLVQDESCSFHVTVSSTQQSSLMVSALKSPGLLLEKTVTRCGIMSDSSPTKVKGVNNILVYKEVSDARITFIIQNKTDNNVNIQMDLSRSSSIVTNKPSLLFTVAVPKKSSVIAAHVLPLTDGSDWNLEAEAKYIRH